MDQIGTTSRINTLEQIPVARNSFYSKYIKRLLDWTLSAMAVVALSPLLLIVVILELLFHGRPIFYTTNRPGKDNKIFRLYKFRSMKDSRNIDGYLLPENQRLTKFGLFLRKTSIDELPELFNILKGDMSIIGPRPLLIEYLDMYEPRHAARQSVRPGLACVRISKKGNAQNTWTWRDQFENDIYYIENISFMLDIKMILSVICEVFKGSSYRVNDTRVPFDGKNLDETRSKEELGIVSRFESIIK